MKTNTDAFLMIKGIHQMQGMLEVLKTSADMNQGLQTFFNFQLEGLEVMERLIISSYKEKQKLSEKLAKTREMKKQCDQDVEKCQEDLNWYKSLNDNQEEEVLQVNPLNYLPQIDNGNLMEPEPLNYDDFFAPRNVE
jgi:hypothetical protein